MAGGKHMIAALLAAGCAAGGDTTGWTVLPGMVASVPWDPYELNPALRGGTTLQRPADGTVPVESDPAFWADAPFESAQNPVPATAEAERRGRDVFETYCTVCHGPRGLGDGPVVDRFPKPPSLVAPQAIALADAQIVHVMTYGRDKMPGYAAQVVPEDRWRVVRYLRRLQESAR